MATKANPNGPEKGQDLHVYYERWQALDRLIDASTQSYEDIEFPRKSTIQYLLKSLRAFAAGQFQFFYYGLDHDNPKRSKQDPLLELSPEFPAEDVLTGILEQIEHDLALIQRAAGQRISGDEDFQRTLANADKLAWMAVKPALDYAMIEEATTVLTYFEKSPEFYRIPYAQVALIALPFTCTANNNHQDYLAIPHEVGHYVFRHKTGDAAQKLLQIPSSFKQSPQADQDWIKAIFEETFADVYGCLIAGPVIALDMQDVSLANSQTDFREGDGRHPNPVLRPVIYCLVLESPDTQKLSIDNWQPIAEKLSKQWQARLDQRQVSTFVIKTGCQDSQNQVVTATETHDITEVIDDVISTKSEPSQGSLGEDIQTFVAKIIGCIRGYFEAYNPTHYSKSFPGWAGTIEPETEVSQLYRKFEDNFCNLLTEVKLMPPESDPSSASASAGGPDAHTPQFWLDWAKTENQLKEWPPAGPIPSGEVKNPDETQKGKWGYILYADGWTTSGPSPDPGHPFG